MKTSPNPSSKGYRNAIKQSKIKGLFQNVALFLTSLLLFVLVLEVGFRLFGYGNLVIYKPDPKLFWKPLPNQNVYTKFGHKPVHINVKGTRGKNFNEAKSENVFRIISLGDSKTFGWGLRESETYSRLLENLLQNWINLPLKIEVVNAGVNAWSYAQMYVYLRDTGIRYSPDLVILADANLWTQFSENRSKEFIETFMRQVWLKNLLRRSSIYHYLIEVKLKRYYNKYRTIFIPIDPEKDEYFKEQQEKNPGLYFKKQIIQIYTLLKESNVKLLLVYIPSEGELSSFHKSIALKMKEEISREYNVPLIDSTKDLSRSPQRLFFLGDPVHPNAEGNKIIADGIFNFIKETKFAEKYRKTIF